MRTAAASAAIAAAFLITATGRAETSLRTFSYGGDWVGGNLRVTDADGTFQARSNYLGGVSVSFCRNASLECWLVEFSAQSNHPLDVGFYPDARRYIANEAGSAGLSISGDGRGCNHSTGWFQVKELRHGSNGAIDAFRAVFEQSCDESGGGLVGEVRWNVDVPVAVHPTPAVVGHRRETLGTWIAATERDGGPVRLSASALPRGATFEDHGDGQGEIIWSPRLDQLGRWPVIVHAETSNGASDSTIVPIRVAGTTRLHVMSEIGDPVGLGRRETRGENDGVFSTDTNLRESRVVAFRTSPTTFPTWVMYFEAPFGQPLAEGIFVGATNRPFGSLDRPRLGVSSDGGWCRNDIIGGFEVHDIGFGVWGNLDRFNASFDQRCTEASGGLHGEILLNADVIENSAPIAKAGTAQPVVECTAAGSAFVRLAGSQSSDPDGDPLDYSWAAESITFDDATSPTPSVLFPLGTTVVTLAVTDGRASSTAELAVTVVDTSPPELTVSSQPSVLWPPNGRMVDVQVDAHMFDRCDPNPALRLVSVTSSDPRPRSNVVDIDGAVLVSPDTEFRLRAARDAGDRERRYSIVYAARDASGNTASVAMDVTVPHDLSK